MYCPYCGEKVDVEWSFCSSCSKSLSGVKDKKNIGATVLTNEKEQSKKWFSKKVVISIVVLLFFLGGGIAYWINCSSSETIQTSDRINIAETKNENIKSDTPLGMEDFKLKGVSLGDGASFVVSQLGEPKIRADKSEGESLDYGYLEVIIRGGVINLITSDHSIATRRGIHVGDNVQKVTESYGESAQKTKYNNLNLHEYHYKNESNKKVYVIRFAINNDSGLVEYIGCRSLNDVEIPKVDTTNVSKVNSDNHVQKSKNNIHVLPNNTVSMRSIVANPLKFYGHDLTIGPLYVASNELQKMELSVYGVMPNGEIDWDARGYVIYFQASNQEAWQQLNRSRVICISGQVMGDQILAEKFIIYE